MSISSIREVFNVSRPMLLVHGGAWDIPKEEHQNHLDGMKAALSLGAELLRSGMDAFSTCSRVVSVLENHEAFDAGYGSVLTKSGMVEMDAGIMDGASGSYGSVMGVRTIKNPILAAQSLASYDEGQARMLISNGAEAFALAQGLEIVEEDYFKHERELERFKNLSDSKSFHTSHAFGGPKGTVGCVVLDSAGSLAAATSTGGAPFTLSGRVGDSPLPGCGFYADRESAISCTGWGEAIAGSVLAARLADLSLPQIRQGEGAKLLEKMHARYSNDRVVASGGYIYLSTAHAEVGFTTPCMARSSWTEEAGIVVRVGVI